MTADPHGLGPQAPDEGCAGATAGPTGTGHPRTTRGSDPAGTSRNGTSAATRPDGSGPRVAGPRVPPPDGTPGRDRGSATVLVLSLCLVLTVLATALAAVASAAVVRHRAGQAADSAALAAATRALSGAEAACRAADELAQASGAVLLDCRLETARADVLVEVRPHGWLSRFGAARGRARAGPATVLG